MRDTGTATLGMNVYRGLLRNRNTTRITSTVDNPNAISTSRTDSRIVVVRSITTDIWIAGDIEDCRTGSIARTRSAVAMMFAPGCLKIMTRTAGLPFTK